VSAPPEFPSLRALTAELRALHDAWSHPEAGGEYVELVQTLRPDSDTQFQWTPEPVGVFGGPAYGREFIPGSTERECSWCDGEHNPFAGQACPECDGSGRVSTPSPFDATAAARRLLAAARDATVNTAPIPPTEKDK
jgi:hypothetical protein